VKSRVASRLKQRIKRPIAGVLLAACLMPSILHAQQSILPVQQGGNPQLLRQSPQQTEQPSGQQQAQQNGISQKRALEIARASFAGNVISISEVRPRNAAMRYRIRMDNEGNIFTVFVDSRSGAITRE
jgi:hypothetical protein